MVKRTGPTNPYLKQLIIKLERFGRKNKRRIWLRVAELLRKPTRKRIEVNISKINRYAKDGDTILVPGVVLGSGTLTKKVTVAAWRFSSKAREKIESSGGEAISIEELLEKNPKGSNVKIFA